MPRRLTFQFGGYIAGLVAVCLITLIYYRHILVVRTTTVVLTFLLAILVGSAVWGFGVSVVMSVAATLCVDYFFLPPVGTFNINDPDDWVTLFSFLVTAMIGSELSARARRQAEEARQQRNEVSRLYEFSQRLLSAQNPQDLLNEIPSQIVHLFEGRSAALYLSGKQSIHRAGDDVSELNVAHLQAIQGSEEFKEDSEKGLLYGPVRLGSQIIGSFGIYDSTVSKQTFEAIATLIAAAIDRLQAIELLGKTEAARESERLKSVLLDAIAHDFKTPHIDQGGGHQPAGRSRFQ